MKMTRKEAIRIAVLLAIMGIIIHFLIMNGFGNILSIKVINGDVNDCYFELYNIDDTPIDTSSYKITVKDNTITYSSFLLPHSFKLKTDEIGIAPRKAVLNRMFNMYLEFDAQTHRIVDLGPQYFMDTTLPKLIIYSIVLVYWLFTVLTKIFFLKKKYHDIPITAATSYISFFMACLTLIPLSLFKELYDSDMINLSSVFMISSAISSFIEILLFWLYYKHIAKVESVDVEKQINFLNSSKIILFTNYYYIFVIYLILRIVLALNYYSV